VVELRLLIGSVFEAFERVCADQARLFSEESNRDDKVEQLSRLIKQRVTCADGRKVAERDRVSYRFDVFGSRWELQLGREECTDGFRSFSCGLVCYVLSSVIEA
jgi:hypothetical protein